MLLNFRAFPEIFKDINKRLRLLILVYRSQHSRYPTLPPARLLLPSINAILWRCTRLSRRKRYEKAITKWPRLRHSGVSFPQYFFQISSSRLSLSIGIPPFSNYCTEIFATQLIFYSNFQPYEIWDGVGVVFIIMVWDYSNCKPQMGSLPVIFSFP